MFRASQSRVCLLEGTGGATINSTPNCLAPAHPPGYGQGRLGVSRCWFLQIESGFRWVSLKGTTKGGVSALVRSRLHLGFFSILRFWALLFFLRYCFGRFKFFFFVCRPSHTDCMQATKKASRCSYRVGVVTMLYSSTVQYHLPVVDIPFFGGMFGIWQCQPGGSRQVGPLSHRVPCITVRAPVCHRV